jgi:drug/metabolite transporter (DMT)-like permease
MDTPLGVSFALLSALSWAVASTLFQRIGDAISPLGLNLFCSGLGLLLLAVVVVVGGGADVDGRALAILAASGLIGIALGDTLFFAALQELGAHAVVVLAMLAPVLTVALAVIALGETPTPRAAAGIALVLVGVFVVLRSRAGEVDARSTRRGLGFGLGAVIAMAVGTVVAKEGVETVSALDATVVRMAAGTLGLLGFGAARGALRAWLRPLADRALLGRVALAVVVITFGGFFGLHAALKHVDLALAAAANATEPLFVIPLAAVFLGERVRAAGVVGTAIASGGVALLYLG